MAFKISGVGRRTKNNISVDFTLSTYHQLLDALIAQGYAFQTFAGFLEKPEERVIMLRHDVEARYENALAFARVQHERNIRGTYYFRFLPNHFSTEIIREIAAMGHEIGYHYDDLSFCKGDREKALQRFEKNLATLRKIAPVKTICMEGAPLSKWDNRTLWAKHQIPNNKSQTNSKNQISNPQIQEPGSPNPEPETLEPGTLEPWNSGTWNSGTCNYRDYGILGEPYFDLDFSQVLYLTDTGRRWDGVGSIRDKINPKSQIPNPKQNPKLKTQNSELKTQNSELKTQNSELKTQNFIFRHTKDIITHVNLLPDQLMLTFHPQRWTDRPLPWVKELVMQNVKNVVKSILLRLRA